MHKFLIDLLLLGEKYTQMVFQFVPRLGTRLGLDYNAVNTVVVPV